MPVVTIKNRKQNMGGNSIGDDLRLPEKVISRPFQGHLGEVAAIILKTKPLRPIMPTDPDGNQLRIS